MALQRLGPFELSDVLGRGGMGTVYKAVHVESADVVALKALAPAYSFDEHFRRRFEGEIEALMELDHPWIQEYFNGPRGRAALTAQAIDELRRSQNNSLAAQSLKALDNPPKGEA